MDKRYLYVLTQWPTSGINNDGRESPLLLSAALRALAFSQMAFPT